MPSWYPLLKAARWLGVTPEYLRSRPLLEMEQALVAAEVEELVYWEKMAKYGLR